MPDDRDELAVLGLAPLRAALFERRYRDAAALAWVQRAKDARVLPQVDYRCSRGCGLLQAWHLARHPQATGSTARGHLSTPSSVRR